MRCWDSQCGDWVYPTVVLCIFGFFTFMRPGQPFLTPYLTGPYKNLTIEQVLTQIYPVWTYTNLFFLVPVFLLTDILRYKPVVVLQGVAYVSAWLLLLFGSGVRSMQSALFSYGLASALEVGYSSYIYSVVHTLHYQRVTSYCTAAVLLGYGAGSFLGQILVSFGISLYCLNVITLISLSIALFTTVLLPMPQKRCFRSDRPSEVKKIDLRSDSGRDLAQPSIAAMMKANWRWTASAAMKLATDCKDCYSSTTLFFLSLWWAMGKCGFYQISSYVQILWTSKQPHNFTEYNGGIDAVSTLSGAMASFAAGHVTAQWSLWAELVLGLISAVIAGAIYLMDLTSSIWICYACYPVFKSSYMFLLTICTFQIAKTLSRETYALMFGMNTFVALVLQAILTATVINTKSLDLTLTTQFFIYASYFATIAVIFLIRGVYTLLRLTEAVSVNGITGEALSERSTHLPQNTQL